MKASASEIKVGQVIKYGNSWGKVIEAPKQSNFRCNEVDILVEVLPANIKRRLGYTDRFKGGYITTFSYRKSTLVQVK